MSIENSKPEAAHPVERLVMRPEWADKKADRAWTINSLAREIASLRMKAFRARKRHESGAYPVNALYLADAYDDAADALQRHIDVIK